MGKAKVTLGGVPLAGKSAIVWKLITGAAPYRTVMQVHKSDWSRLRGKLGKSITLRVQDSRDTVVNIRDVSILHQVASDSPNRVSFVVADRRWKFPYKLIVRDFNITRKSGDKNTFYDRVPVENMLTIDEYTFKKYSLNASETKWTAEEALDNVLYQLMDDGGKRSWIESFPVDREFTLQNVVLRDQGDVALARMLSFIPGCEAYVDTDGILRIINAADYTATDKHLKQLPDATWDGDKVVTINRNAIRPEGYKVFFTRETEIIFEFSDDWSTVEEGHSMSEDLDKFEPFLENVIPTVDPTTTVIDRWLVDQEKYSTTKVLAGTWLPADQWLKSMNLEELRPEGSLPWTWQTVRRHWFKGDLEGVLAGGGSRGVPDLDPIANWSQRVQALRQHFRQTFRINPRYMDRIRSLEAIRVGPWDPVTGARSYASVWGEICIIPSVKGQRMASRRDEDKTGVWRNVRHIPEEAEGGATAFTPGPARVEFIDRDQGIFRINWLSSPYGTRDAILPCMLVNDDGEESVPVRNLAEQKTKTIAPGSSMSGGTNGIFLKDTMDLKVLITMVPGAPNNRLQFHEQEVEASDIEERFQDDLRISDGSGPTLEIFIPPGEAMARYQWSDDDEAKQSVKDLLGIEYDDPTISGLDPAVGMKGFTFTNEENEVKEYAKAAAAEMAVSFADQVQGTVSHSLPKKTGGGSGRGGRSPMMLRGNVSDVSLQVGAHPSGKVSVATTFPGMAKPISRFALLPEAVRHIVLGIVPLKEADK